MNAVTRFQERFQQVQHEAATRPREKPLDILEHECPRSRSRNEGANTATREFRCVIGPPPACGRKTLTRWTAGNHCADGHGGRIGDRRLYCMCPNVGPVRFHGGLPVIDRMNRPKTGCDKPERQTTCPTEQVH